ncbi:phenylalanine--tRNA ligase subunit alpha [Fuchsiella alkaliacetigena]|uniref:phenylalanine--tRNA ligase subunit alpha n=1 Tax=Fuchsiella alkaliacetigena TaxID=957042 RepID=UPI00200A405A|nr:phenylalanine--tRNA ligase subunit alpha [Fuchsiella alkaliacetigena]MCK8825054.1 phenylalanine--tRNA ligase subunit alpha [Fuchsiella alkaliacetigena]
MEEKLENIEAEAKAAIKEATDLDGLEELRVKYLGKKGQVTEILQGIGDLEPEQRPVVGKLGNQIKSRLEALIEDKEEELKELLKQKKLEEEQIDVTLPGVKEGYGYQHPLTQTLAEIKEVFLGLGFSIAEGPEVEKDYYNFEALNIPKTHPARDMQDSFYISADILLRTHTSPVQIRTMKQSEVPIRIIAPGRVYRVDEVDANHSPVFHQVEGLMVGQDISFSQLKGILIEFAQEMFGADREVRFRPSYFPFTEPSAEVDVSCIVCAGEGCRVCSQTGWLEILGSGMVHPRVLEMSGLDPQEVSGFAFGMGVERIAMLKYGITDIRLFYENDMRFLEQF